MATIYQHVTDAIVKALEAGSAPWLKPWSEDSKAASPWGLPVNVSNGREYRGANIVLLWSEAQRQGYSDDAWLTLKQANALGGRILKGERPVWVHFWHWNEKEVRGERKRVPTLRAYRVFNQAQTEGCEFPERSEVRVLGAGAIEDRVRALGARVRLGGNRAYFDPGHDRIAVPLPDKFKSPDAFHATLLHEMVHWTGHGSRLDRGVANHFGTPEYAREELVAELGSAFLCARFGIALEGLQHPEYLASWIKVLRSDSRAILQAASAAQKAADFVMGDGAPKDSEPVPEAAEPVEEPASVVVCAPVDDDTRALAAQYICDAARKLYWAGHADALDREMAERAAMVERRRLAPAVAVIMAYARELFALGSIKPKRIPRCRIRRGNVAPVAGRWERHPVTGYAMFVREGVELADLIPFGRDDRALAQVRTEWARHGRIGAANTLVHLARSGLAEDAKGYRKGMQSRRAEAGECSPSYSYGAGRIDVAHVLEAVEIRDDGSTRAIGLR
jgi:antirestriction protein ArdC